MPSARMKVVLVATDLENRSLGAARLGAFIADAAGARLIALHVVELPASLRRWGGAAAQSDAALYRKLLAKQIKEAQPRLESHMAVVSSGALEAHCLVRAGWVAETVGEVADQYKVDLIVVARGQGGRLGVNSEQIVRAAGRAVLVAPVKMPLQPWAFGRSGPRLATSHRRSRAAKPSS